MKIILCCLLLLLAFLFNFSAVSGCSPVPSDKSVVSSDGKFILVMFDKMFAKDYQVKDALRKYPSSGIYENNGSIVPVHVIEDWFSFEGREVAIANDGSHFARLKYKSIELYNEGQLLKSYTLPDIGLPAPAPLNGDCAKAWWASTKIYNNLNRLTVEAKGGQYFYFDLITGNEIGKSDFITHFFFGEENLSRNVIVVVLGTLATVVILLLKRRKRRE